MDLSEARGLMLCWVIRGGMRDYTEAAYLNTSCAYGMLGCSPSNPSVSRTESTTPRKTCWEMNGLFSGDAQAACDFSFSASKFSPFFHRVSVMAAILRASVSRAIV